MGIVEFIDVHKKNFNLCKGKGTTTWLEQPKLTTSLCQRNKNLGGESCINMPITTQRNHNSKGLRLYLRNTFKEKGK